MPTETPPAARPRFTLLVQAGLLIAALAGLAWFERPDGRLHVFLPALAGDAVIIRLPSGGVVLVDGGAEPSALVGALGRVMPFWQRDIQAVILTSADGRFLAGQVEALAHYRAHGAFAVAPALASRTASSREWRRLVQEHTTPVHALKAGQRIDLGDGVELRVLAAGDGALLELVYGATTAVLAHNPPPELESLSRNIPRTPSSLALFPWEQEPHGSLLDALQPRAVVYSDGYQSDQAVQLSYAERRVGRERQYHERLDGAIEWISDGAHIFIATEQK